MLSLLLLLPRVAIAQQNQRPEIVAPSPGEALLGVVAVRGELGRQDAVAVEFSFTYAEAALETWFFLARIDGPFDDGLVSFEWDTTLITDGDYVLRMAVTRADGSRESVLAEGLRVRNYSAIETSTPTPIPSVTPAPTLDPGQFTPTPSPTVTPTALPSPTVTPLPTNPAQITPSRVANTVLRGAAGAFAAILIVGLYTSLRRALRR